MSQVSGKNANPFWRRLHHAWLALRGRQRHKSNETRFMDFGRMRCKQVTFPDSAEAVRVERLLRESAGLALFPGFLFRLESTAWVQFVPGRSPNPQNGNDLEAMHRFFVGLYRARPVERKLDETDLHPCLIARLRLLGEAGRLDAGRVTALEALADRLRPERVWTGLDYIDALAKNFIIGERGAVGVDIEAIRDCELLGTGLAKARHRWLGDRADRVVELLAQQGGPPLAQPCQ